MEYLWLFIVILIIIIIFQFKRNNKLEKNWSPDKDWYKNEIPRDLKEDFVRNLDYYLDEKNINTQEFFEYLSENEKEIEVVVECILEKTNIRKLYLPKGGFCYIIHGKKNYRYIIGRQQQLFQIIDSLPGELEQYCYDFDTLSEEYIFSIIDLFGTNIKEYPQKQIHVLLKKGGKIFFSTTRWWDLGNKHQWWSLNLEQNISDSETREIWVDPEQILLLPKTF